MLVRQQNQTKAFSTHMMQEMVSSEVFTGANNAPGLLSSGRMMVKRGSSTGVQQSDDYSLSLSEPYRLIETINWQGFCFLVK